MKPTIFSLKQIKNILTFWTFHSNLKDHINIKCVRAFCLYSISLQIFCMQNDTLFRLLCHLAHGRFAYRNRVNATNLCVKLPISVSNMRQNICQHLSHSAYEMGWKSKVHTREIILLLVRLGWKNYCNGLMY
jgi:hypothetical protein